MTVELTRIAELLAPFLDREMLAPAQLHQVSTYIDLLLKWNSRMNLTAVRDPEQIVTRHFGESFFTARALFPDPSAEFSLADVGSGAGFPGLPIALLRPNVRVALIEAHGKKATFLKEAIRALSLSNAEVAPVRAEDYQVLTNVVTLRAVEQFASVLPVAARMVAPGGRLAILVGSPQIKEYKAFNELGFHPGAPVYFPGSTQRVLWILDQSA
jgi:16S rRNA (guanine527-N7)-methyltransferase